MAKRVIIIGVGGATCSGKTTLAKHLRNVLPNSFILHQDDYAPPQELVPLHPTLKIQDWDDPRGAIQWDRLRASLAHIRASGGELPPEHRSHDHLNKQVPVPVDEGKLGAWGEEVRGALKEREKEGERETVFVLLDGFLCYWDEGVIAQLDIPLFLRTPTAVLKARREARAGYVTQEGGLWVDPPGYWEDIVYPAYLLAHCDVFQNGDVDAGAPTGKVPGLEVLDCGALGMDGMVRRAVERVVEKVREGEGR